jgi:hypothetical protein
MKKKNCIVVSFLFKNNKKLLMSVNFKQGRYPMCNGDDRTIGKMLPQCMLNQIIHNCCWDLSHIGCGRS